MRVFVALAFVFGAACATDTGYGALQTSWDQATPSNAAPAPAPAPGVAAKKDPAAPKTVTAKELAGELGSATKCLEQAKEYYAKDPHHGETLLQECVRRDDFIDLDKLLRGPWTKDLRASEPLQMLVAQTIAHRGGFVEQDTKACRAAGLSIYDVTTALQQGGKAVGKLVLVRGSVAQTDVEKWGKGKVPVATIAESTWADEGGEEGGPIPARDSAEDTGRLVFARITGKDDQFSKDHPLIVAVRLEGPRTYHDKDGEDQKSIIGVAVGGFETANKLRQ